MCNLVPFYPVRFCTHSRGDPICRRIEAKTNTSLRKSHHEGHRAMFARRYSSPGQRRDPVDWLLVIMSLNVINLGGMLANCAGPNPTIKTQNSNPNGILADSSLLRRALIRCRLLTSLLRCSRLQNYVLFPVPRITALTSHVRWCPTPYCSRVVSW